MTTSILVPGTLAEARLTVQATDTAKALCLSPDDDFPAVFSTSRMIALMELAAARCMKSLRQPGQLSVGVGVDIKHTAATPVGVEITAKATFLEQQGKLYLFCIEAFDRGGLIGTGQHTRAIVTTERLLSGARDRNQV